MNRSINNERQRDANKNNPHLNLHCKIYSSREYESYYPLSFQKVLKKPMRSRSLKSARRASETELFSKNIRRHAWSARHDLLPTGTSLRLFGHQGRRGPMPKPHTDQKILKRTTTPSFAKCPGTDTTLAHFSALPKSIQA